jgi:hypothetical protein
VFTLVADWLFSEPMAQLLDAFGARLPAAGASGDRNAEHLTNRPHLGADPPGWLNLVNGLLPEQTDLLRRTLAVERIAAGHFNFRGDVGQQYRERAEATVADFDPQFRRRVLALTDRLGLVSPRPPRFRRYDKTLILGGGYRSPLLRTRYAAQLRAPGVDLGELSFLGSPRFLIEEPSERAVTESYAPGAVDEFDLMIGAARTEFGWTAAGTSYLCGCTTPQAGCPKWSHRDAAEGDRTPPAYTHERRAPLVDTAGRPAGSVLSASTGRPPLRPDTSDTFSLWARCAQPKPGERILVVTTQIFVPFQTFDGLRRLYLPHGTDLDTVGYGAEWGDRPQTAEYLLQETLSAIRSARRLLVGAADELRQAYR